MGERESSGINRELKEMGPQADEDRIQISDYWWLIADDWLLIIDEWWMIIRKLFIIRGAHQAKASDWLLIIDYWLLMNDYSHLVYY